MDRKSFTKYNTHRDLPMKIMNFSSISKSTHHKGVFSLFGCAKIFAQPISQGSKAVLFAGLAGVLLAGCGGDQPRPEPASQPKPQAKQQTYTDQSSAVFAPDGAQRSASERSGDGSIDLDDPSIKGWSIVLVNAGNSIEQAQAKLLAVQVDGGLKEAFIDKRPEGYVIAYGRYLNRTDPKAVDDLNRIRGIRKMGIVLFPSAIITPPTSDDLRGSNASYDLRLVKDRYGDLAIYTLQIGIYGRADFQAPKAKELAEYRLAAEEAVRELRADGVMAFYYHAPARSMVTVGVFGERDFDATTLPPMESRMLRDMRERFPHNLVNGQGVNETLRTESGKITRMQSSQLVGIPNK